MWEEHKIWHRYLSDIIASDSDAAHFLAAYIKRARTTGDHTVAMEVIDLQKYRIISRPAKVRVAMRERLHIPFVFLYVRN